MFVEKNTVLLKCKSITGDLFDFHELNYSEKLKPMNGMIESLKQIIVIKLSYLFFRFPNHQF